MIAIFQAPPIAPGELCLLASRRSWERMLLRLQKGTVEMQAVQNALASSDAAMIKVSLSPRAASLVLARAKM